MSVTADISESVNRLELDVLEIRGQQVAFCLRVERRLKALESRGKAEAEFVEHTPEQELAALKEHLASIGISWMYHEYRHQNGHITWEWDGNGSRGTSPTLLGAVDGVLEGKKICAHTIGRLHGQENTFEPYTFCPRCGARLGE